MVTSEHIYDGEFNQLATAGLVKNQLPNGK